MDVATIQNFSPNPYRRVDVVAQLHRAVDPTAAIHVLEARLDKVPDVEILQFNMPGMMPVGCRAGGRHG